MTQPPTPFDATFGGATATAPTPAPTNTFGGGTFGGAASPPPQSQIDILRALLNDPIPPGGTDQDAMFTDAALIAMLTLSSSMAEAAQIGWTRKAMLYADPNRLVRGQIGNETLE